MVEARTWGGGGGGKGGERKFAKRWVHISFRFRVTQNLVPLYKDNNISVNALHYRVNSPNTFMRTRAKYATVINGITL